MGGQWPFTAEKIATRLDLIKPHIFRKKQVLPHFRLLPLKEATVAAPICSDTSDWEEIEHESYWGRTDLNFVMKSSFVVPDDWDEENIALHLPLGVMGDIFNHPEALVHIDTLPIGSADRYHHTIPLKQTLKDGREHVLSLHGWTGHAGWPIDPDSRAKLFMGEPSLVERDPVLQAFHSLSSAALDAVQTMGPDNPACSKLLAALDHAFLVLDTRDPIGDALHDSAAGALQALEDGIQQAGAPLDVTLHGVGHAHMDIAYLWPISQIRLKNARTYTNVLRLMDEEPDYKFAHSQPQLYAYTAEDYPALFEQIKERVAEGRWEVMGGMWVEPDLNIPGPESLVRQFVLGRKYFRETFGDVETPVLWLPDTFGFPGQIPQLMKLAGLKWFATNKLNWNQKNKVTSTTHIWEGIDNSKVLAHILTTPRDVQHLPFPTNYKSDLSAAEVLGTWEYSTAQDQVQDLPICYGYGDGGGGPTEDLIAKARAYGSMPGMPRLQMSSVREVFQQIEKSADQLSVWSGEHYMEGHRGVLTSQAWIKRANRKAEIALHEAEALAAMAGTKPDLEEAWKLLCLNQFHDIITGTSIGEVFDDAREDFARIEKLTEAATLKATEGLASNETIVANTVPTSGSRLVFVPDVTVESGQPIEDGSLVYFEHLPSYSLTPLSKSSQPSGGCDIVLEEDGARLENDQVRIRLAANGQLSEVWDKRAERQVLDANAFGNVLQAFEDRPVSWDAWDIDPFFEDRREDIDTKCEMKVVEEGPLRVALKLNRTWRNSKISQIVRLAAHSARIDFVTDINWHETHTLLKVAFPTCVKAASAEFDIQWGKIERATERETDFDAARFEVPTQKWTQLSEPEYSVAVLNDCKYGCDVHGNIIRLTLIKSATFPDPEADQGHHEFTYSLLPNHEGDRSSLNHEAYDLNGPARVLAPDGANKAGVNTDPIIRSSNPHAIIETIKPANNGDGVIVRLFECAGETCKTHLVTANLLARVEFVDLIEQPLGEAGFKNDIVELSLDPFQIVSLRIKLK